MSILEAIRRDSSAAIWSRGVEIARSDKVIGESANAEEVVLRVALRPGSSPFMVNLWPGDEEWSCDCPSHKDTCVHVVGAVIAWNQARLKGSDLPRAKEIARRVGYRFVSGPRGLTLSRVITHNGSDQALTRPLKSQQRLVVFGDSDLEVEKVMAQRFDRLVPREWMPRLLRGLQGCEDITVNGQPVTANSEPVVPQGRVESVGDGFLIRIVRDPTIKEVYGSGVVRCGDVLRPVGRAGLSDDQFRLLSRGVNFAPEEVSTLVAETLPRLRERITVKVCTDRLPEVDGSPPRLVVETSTSGETLEVHPRIVYGDPPTAHLERGQLVLRGGVVPIRRERMEERLARQCTQELGLPVGLKTQYQSESAVRFVDRFGSFSGEVSGAGWRRFRRAEPIQPQIQVNGDQLDIDWDGVDGDRLLRAWQGGESLVPLTSGGWAPLPDGWLDEHGHRVFDLLASRDESGRIARYALFDLAKLCEDLNQPPPPGLTRLKSLVDDFSGIPTSPLPDDLTAVLREYQRNGVNWLHFLREAEMGGILADDMGLGKTVQALCVIYGRTLVVAPTSVLHNWAAEIARFRPNLKVCFYHGSRRQMDETADITLTSYALLRLDRERLSSILWETVILDEAQAIKNPQSQVAQSAFGLTAKFRLTLTGTPVENRLEELWSQFHFLNPGLLGGWRDFLNRYSRPISLGDHEVVNRLRDRIRPFILRRLKSEVAPELPPRTDITLRCSLSPEERRAYDTVRAAAQEKITSKLGLNVMAALEALLRLRQASCHTGLLPGHVAEVSSKVQLLMSTLESILSGGHKVLIFSQWTSMLNLIEPHLNAAEIPFVRLDGQTQNRGAVVNSFQSDDGPPVFLISLKAGGTGLNLTAADHVFLFDPWWNPAVEEQAADRAHRIGQERPVMVYRLVAENTVEERIMALKERKRALAETAIGGADHATRLTRADLLALLD